MSTEAPPHSAVPLAPPRRRLPLAVLLLANAISMIGNQLAVIAIPWFVLQTTGSATKTGIAAVAEAVPAVVAALLGGAFVDRMGFKRASILGDLLSGAALALVPALYFTVGVEYWQLLLLIFLANFCDIPGATARSALLPDLAELAGMRIERAGSALQAIERGSRLVGAPLAGVLIALLGASTVLWVDAATFIASALLVALAVPRLATKRAERARATGTAGMARGHAGSGLWAGLRFLLRTRLVLALVVIVMLMNFVDVPFGGVILPVYVQRAYGDPLALGLMFAASGLGAVVGALLYGAFAHRLPRRGVFLLGLLVVTARYAVLTLLPPLAAILAMQLLTGLAAGPFNPIIGTIEYERIPPALRGRVLGAAGAGAYFAVPFGLLAGGLLIDRIGIHATLAASGACYLAIFVVMLLAPTFRGMGAPGHASSASGPLHAEAAGD